MLKQQQQSQKWMKGGEINENAKREEVKSFVISAAKKTQGAGGRGRVTSSATAAKPQRNEENFGPDSNSAAK